MKINLSIIIFCSIMCNCNLISAQYTKQWAAAYGAYPNSYEHTSYIAIDTAEQFVYTLVLSDSMSIFSNILLKHRIDNGQQIWEKRLESADLTNKMCLDNEQNIYICGHSIDATSTSHFWVAKYNTYGILMWKKSFDDSLSYHIQSAYSVVADALGSIYIIGIYNRNEITKNISVIVKYDSLGNKLWSQEYPDTLQEVGLLKIDRQNNVYALNYSGFSVAKYSSQGILQWITKVPFNANEHALANLITTDSSDNLYIMGTIHYYNNIFGYEVARVNNDGVFACVKKNFPTYISFGDVSCNLLVDKSQNNIIISGITDPNTEKDLVYKLNSSTGQEIWQLEIPNTYNSHIIAINKQNNLLCLDNNDSGGKYILWLTEYNNNGIKTYSQKLDSSTTKAFTRHIIVDRKDNILQAAMDGDIQIAQYTLNNTSIKNLENKTAIYSVYPNPFNTSITFKTENRFIEEAFLTLFDPTGKEVLQQTFNNSNTITINRKQLFSGIYFYTIRSENVVLQSGKIMAK